LCKIGADFILRGLRNPADFEFEKTARIPIDIYRIETVFLLTGKNILHSSSIVRDVLRNSGE
jgi:pantetheine-phosphate adenylyltransferase